MSIRVERQTRGINTAISYERRVLLMVLGVGLPGVATAIALLWAVDIFEGPAIWLATATIIAAWLILAFAVRRRIVFPLQTTSNLLAALREGDFSVRVREFQSGDTLEELTREVNMLAETLQEQRLGAVEATTLLRNVMEGIDVAVFTFDGEHRLKLLNRAAERLLNVPAERALGQSAELLGLERYIHDDAPHVFDATFPGGTGRWEIRRASFRQGGRPHQLLVISDLTRTLREEELKAWQRIVRVIGHELNNSLTPIKSISSSLQSQLTRDQRSEDWEEDLARGLAVISSRSESLARFMSAYARLARLPQPRLQAVDVEVLVRRVARLETRLATVIEGGPHASIQADPDQIEQVLINLVRNAVDASLETGGEVRLGWKQVPGGVELAIEDDGHGLLNTSNLFVPFFTTKPGGTGIGLILSRQIAEAHHGSLRLENRSSGRGCVAVLRLPM